MENDFTISVIGERERIEQEKNTFYIERARISQTSTRLTRLLMTPTRESLERNFEDFTAMELLFVGMDGSFRGKLR
jgi:hypothetical protein